MTEGSSRGGVGAAWPVRGRTSAWAGDVKGTGGAEESGTHRRTTVIPQFLLEYK